MLVAVAQFVGTWLGEPEGSSPAWTEYRVWTGSWRGSSSPPMGISKPPLSKAPNRHPMRQPPHSDIPLYNNVQILFVHACIRGLCVRVNNSTRGINKIKLLLIVEKEHQYLLCTQSVNEKNKNTHLCYQRHTTTNINISSDSTTTNRYVCEVYTLRLRLQLPSQCSFYDTQMH